MRDGIIQRRISRHLEFLNRKRLGDSLLLHFSGKPGFGAFWINEFMKHPVEYYLDRKKISVLNDRFLNDYRKDARVLLDMGDDSIPDIVCDFSQGASVSLMCGLKVKFESNTGWLRPDLSPEEIDLNFNASNHWVQFHLMVCEDLISKWDGDFTLLPIIHRSPLDAAWALLDDKIFLMMHDEPETVLGIVMKCAEWELEFERYFDSNLKWPSDLCRGLWAMALPDRAVAVNGDPVDLISSEWQQYFDKPSCEKLFTNTGGGYFHHHSLGLRQVENISYTKGTLIQQITDDPSVEFHALAMINDDAICQKVIDASKRIPVLLFGNFSQYIDRMLPILSKGCFILVQTDKNHLPEIKMKMQNFLANQQPRRRAAGYVTS